MKIPFFFSKAFDWLTTGECHGCRLVTVAYLAGRSYLVDPAIADEAEAARKGHREPEEASENHA